MKSRAELVLCGIVLLAAAACAPRKATSVSATATNNRAVRVSSENVDAAEPAIATGPDGLLYVVWVEHRPDARADVMLAKLDRAGQRTGDPTRVNSESGMATAWRGDPPTVAVSREGVVYVGWTARVDSPSGQATDIYFSTSHDGGRSFTKAVKVNDDQRPTGHGMHSLAIGNDGTVYVAWLDDRNIAEPMPSTKAQGHHMESNREVFVTSSKDGGKTFLPNKRVASDVCPCCKTALVVGPEGRVYLGWRQVLPGDFRHIAIASSSDGAKTFSKGVIVSDDRWVLAGCPVSGPAQTVAADGALRVLWYSEGQAGEKGLYWSESRDGGQTFAPRKQFARGQTFGNPVAIAGEAGYLNAVWSSGPGEGSHLEKGRVDSAGQITRDTGAANAELPAAALSDNRLFIAYISKGESGRAIWLTSD